MINSMPEIPHIHFSRWSPLLLVSSIAMLLLLALLGGLAYALEDAATVLWFSPLWLAGGGWLFTILRTLPRALTRQEDALRLQWWWRECTVEISEIVAARHNRYHVQLNTADGAYHFRVLSPAATAELLTWLEAQAPQLVAAPAGDEQTPFPIILTPRLTAPLITGGMAIVFAAVGTLLLWFNLHGHNGEPAPLEWFQIGFGSLTLGLAALFGYIIIDTYIWRITLDEERITLRRTLRRVSYPAAEVINTALVSEERTVKGFVHRVWLLRLTLLDGQTVDIAPNLPNFPMDYAGAEEVRLLSAVHAVLQAHYRPITTAELDPEGFNEPQWGTPQAAYQWRIRPYDLTVTRLDYGEHHAAASTVHILISHAAAGALRFRTTNGAVQVSPDGRFVVLHDETLLLAFNLQNGRIYHRSSRRGWLYGVVNLADDHLLIEELRQTNAQEREPRRPISLTSPTSALRRGFGPAEDGAFPSAYG